MNITIAVGPGDLIDRISILEIKSERVTEADSNRRAKEQLSHLRAALDESFRKIDSISTPPQIGPLTGELKGINQSLWEAEDQVRLYEKQEDFGERFVELARSIYRLNDRRAAIKQEIDFLLGSSSSSEVKSYSP